MQVQYRMNAVIAAFPSRVFYDSFLESGVETIQHQPPRGLSWPVARDLAVSLPQFESPVKREASGYVLVPVALVQLEDSPERLAGSSMVKAGGEKEEGVSTGTSWENVGEAELAVATAYALAQGRDLTSIAMLAPYTGQARSYSFLLFLSASVPCTLHRAQRRAVLRGTTSEYGARYSFVTHVKCMLSRFASYSPTFSML